MYKIALVQNQSEMIRYNYADARSLLNFEDYCFDLYTGENIRQLGDFLNNVVYDSVVMGSNALNDARIRESLINQRQSFETYLKGPHGLLILHQMRMTNAASYGFLPEKFDVSGIDRKSKDPEERAVQGKLSINPSHKDHVIVTYPNEVSISLVQERSMHVPGIEGLYWHFIDPLNEKVWNTIILDSSYTEARNLLLVSRADLRPRIVVTSLTLDWHRQVALLENIVRYITEGRHNTVVVVKKGQTSFPFNYFIASLKVAKLPHSLVSSKALSLAKLPLNVHRTIVLDPAWTEEEIRNWDLSGLSDFIKEGGELIHFGKREPTLDKLPMTCVGGETYFQTVKKNALVWIASKFENRLWDGSFWCTVDVLQILAELDEPLDQYSHGVLQYAKLHDIDGSYDEVFGATIALMWIYSLFLGPKSKEFKKSLEWIKKRINKCNLYEKAFAYEMLLRMGIPVEKRGIRNFRDEVMKQVQVLSELKAFRYANTLVSYGFIREAGEIAKRLKVLQQEGRWIDVSTTAEVIRFLIRLRNCAKKPSDEIDGMIFDGVIYIHEQFSGIENYWGGKASETIKAIAALQDFESLVFEFPTEQVSNLIRRSSEVQGSITALDSAVNVIGSLREENSTMRQALEKKISREGKLTKLSLASLFISFTSLAFFMLLLGYVVSKGLLLDAVETIKSWVSIEVWTYAIGIAAILLLLYILEKYGLLSKKVSSAIKKVVNRL